MNAPYPSVMTLRSPHDPYRSLPSTPLGIDQRTMAPSDMSLAINHARMGLEVPDYFNAGASGLPSRFGNNGLRPRSPYPPSDLVESERYQSSFEHTDRASSPDMICRTNLAAQLANSQISSSAKYAKIFPHICDDGRYPPDFTLPRTVENMKILDNTQLDRILQSYRLPLDLRPILTHTHTGPVSSSKARTAKLLALWEFLGAGRLVEGVRGRGW